MAIEKLGLRSPSNLMVHLDLLRFVAASGIVITHSRAFLVTGQARDALVTNPGTLFMFVELFFLISGFVIASVYADRVDTWRGYRAFLWRRVARLFPLHLLSMLAFMTVIAAVGFAGIQTGTDFSWEPACIVSSALLVQSIYDCGGVIFNSQSWSISVEMVLYVIFPIVVIVQHRAPPWLAVAVVLIGIGLYASGATEGHWYEVTTGLVWFFLGTTLWRFQEQVRRIPVGSWAVAVCAALLIVEMVVQGNKPITALLIVATGLAAVAADGREPARFVARFAPLGELTYGIYMIHMVVILVVLNGVGDKLLHLAGVPMWIVAAVAYGLIFVTALASYHWFEVPTRRTLQRLPSRLLPRPA